MNQTLCCQTGSQSQTDLAKVTAFLKFINEPNRIKILCSLRHGVQCACDIWKALEIPQNLTSHHLKALKDFGLIDARQEGRKITYKSDKDAIQKHVSLLIAFLISSL